MPNIYLTINHFNKDNNILPWRYIGSDQNDNPNYFGSSSRLKEDIQKLGIDKFSKVLIEKIDNIPNKELRLKEATYLKENNVKHDPTYYNLTDRYAPAGGKKGMKMPARTEEHMRNWSNSRTGWIPSESTRHLWASQRTGKIASGATKELMSQQRTGEKNHNALEWELHDPNGNIIKVKGLRAYCKDNNLSYNRIYHSRDGWKVVKHGTGKGGRLKNAN